MQPAYQVNPQAPQQGPQNQGLISADLQEQFTKVAEGSLEIIMTRWYAEPLLNYLNSWEEDFQQYILEGQGQDAGIRFTSSVRLHGRMPSYANLIVSSTDPINQLLSRLGELHLPHNNTMAVTTTPPPNNLPPHNSLSHNRFP